MCVTSAPSRMSNTLVYAAEVNHEGSLQHVLAYQNKAVTMGPNAMLLPIPAAKPLGPRSALDLTAAPRILKDYAAAITPQSKGVSRGLSDRIRSPMAHVFDSGSYTVVLAERAQDIPRVIDQVPAEKRPTIASELFEAYARLYPDWHVALACFNGKIEAEPIAFTYEPMDPGNLFLPGLDGHDGRAPNLHAMPDRDHTLIWASDSMKKMGSRVASQNHLPAHLRPFFPALAGGTTLRQQTVNGDFYVPIEQLDSNYNPVVTQIPRY